MPLSISCPGCGVTLKVPDAAAGKAVSCPKCKAAMTVPVAVADPEFEVVNDEPVSQPARIAMAHPVKPKSKPAVVLDDDEDVDRPRRRPRRELEGEEDFDERPRQTKRGKKKGIAAWVWPVAGVTAFLVLSVVGYLAFGRGGSLFGPAAPPGWTRVRESSGGFIVFMPGVAGRVNVTVNNQKGDQVGVYSWFSQHTDGTHVRVTSSKVPAGFTPGVSPDELFDHLKKYEGGFQAPWASIVSKTPLTLDGKPALEMRVKPKANWMQEQGLKPDPAAIAAEAAGKGWTVYYCTNDGERVFVVIVEFKENPVNEDMLKTIRESWRFL